MSGSSLQWFAMRATYKRELIAQEYLNKRGIEVFIPFKKEVKIVRGITKIVKEPAIRSLIFVRTTKEILQKVKYGVEYLQYVTKKVDGKNLPIIVPDRQMSDFIQIVQDDNVIKSFYLPGEFSMSSGIRVKVHGGDFDGIEGIVVSGKRNKQFFIELNGLVTMKISMKRLDFIEVVE